MPMKVNGVEGSLSRFALKILFLRSDSGVKKEDFQKQPARAWPLQTTETELFSHFIFISFDENIYQRSTDYSQQI